MEVPLIGPSYAVTQVAQSAQRTCNMFVEPSEAATKTQGMLVPRPGLRPLNVGIAPNIGRVRAMHATADYLYAAIGQSMFRIPGSMAPGTMQQLQFEGTNGNEFTLKTNAGPIEFAENVEEARTQLVLVDGFAGYTIDITSSNPLVRRIDSLSFMANDPPIPVGPGQVSGAPTTVATIDGYVVVGGDGSGYFRSSDFKDARTWNTLDEGYASADADPVIKIVNHQRALWIMGTRVVEVWFNTGPQSDVNLFPFSRNGNVVIETGVVSAATVRKLDSSLIWLGQEGHGDYGVFQTQGYKAQRISTRFIAEAISRCSRPQDAEAWCYSRERHCYYVLNLPGDPISYVYDTLSGLWFEWFMGTLESPQRWRPMCYAFFNGRHVVGLDSYPYFAELDPACDNDGAVQFFEPSSGEPLLAKEMLIQCTRRTQTMADTDSGARLPYADFEVFATPGVASDLKPKPGSPMESVASAPELRLRFSNDGGHNWTDLGPRRLGSIGQYGARARWSRCGSGRDRVWELSFNKRGTMTLLGARVRTTQATA